MLFKLNMEEISNQEYLNKVNLWIKDNNNYLSVRKSENLDESTIKLNLKTEDNNYIILYTNHENDYFFVELDSEMKSNSDINTNIIAINYSIFDSEDLDLNKVLSLIKNQLDETESSNNSSSDELEDEYNVGLTNTNNNFLLVKKKWQEKDYTIRQQDKNINYFNIPKNLLYTPDIIFNIVSNELFKLQNNSVAKYEIDAIDNNIYNLNVKLFFDNNSKLGEQLKKVYENFGYNFIQINFKLNMNLYPYFPPSIELVKPKINNDTVYGIMDLDFLKFENWNPTNSLEFVIEAIHKVFSTHANIDVDCSLNSMETSYLPLEYLLMKLSTKYKLNSQSATEIDVEYTKLSKSSNNNSSNAANKYWKGGVGYGHNSRQEWDINAYIKDQERLDKELSDEIGCIMNEIDIFEESKFNILIKDIVQPSCLFTLIRNRIRGATLMEIDKNNNIYKSIVDMIHMLTNKSLWKIDDTFQSIVESMQNISKECESAVQLLGKDNVDCFYSHIIATNELLQGINVKFNKNEELVAQDLSREEEYMKNMKQYQFGNMNIVDDKSVEFKFRNKENVSNYNPKSLMRIVREISALSSSLPLSYSSTVFMKTDTNNVNSIKFLITGPVDTPYESGCFEFDAFFTSKFPESPPQVLLLTTGGGSVRFNPNLYNCGKVCLSLLGTWSGQKGESWNKDTSTFLQVLVSIQSLIMVDEPYFNEPGWERDMHTETGKRKSFDYNDKVRLNNLKWGIVNQLKNPSKGFEDIIQKHFFYKRETIINRLEKWKEEAKNKSEFDKYFDEAKELLNKLEF